MKLNPSIIKRTYKVSETATAYIFTNSFNVHIELDKNTGEYITGNLHNNEQTQKLFRLLYSFVANK